MITKQGVSIANMNPGTLRGVRNVETMYKCIDEELIVTKTYKRKNDAGSLKYEKDAFEVRFPVMSWGTIVKGVRRVLGPNYIVVKMEDHMYVRYDPEGYNKRKEEGI